MNFKELQLVQDLEIELKKAYGKQAAITAEKDRLLKRVATIDKKLAKKELVNNILKDTKYAKLDIIHDKAFLRSIEEDVAKDFKKRQRKAIDKKHTDAGINTKNTTKEEKKLSLAACAVQYRQKPFTTKQLKDYLVGKKEMAETAQVTQWLAALKLPKKALVWNVPGNKSQGKKIVPSEITWLPDVIKELRKVIGV